MTYEYIALKLVTNETIFGAIHEESKDSVTLLFPMELRVHIFFDSSEGKMFEQTSLTPWMSFTKDRIFIFKEKDILIAKILSDSNAEFYRKKVDEEYSITGKVPEETFTLPEISTIQ